MRAGPATQHTALLQRFERSALVAEDLGITGVVFDDVGDGSTIRVAGRAVVNFGNCSYLGLNLDERLKQGAIEATRRYGPLYSSSQAYSRVDLYDSLNDQFRQITGAPAVLLPPTTTLGHLACLPALVGPEDTLVIDSHSHASLQLTTQVLAGRGIEIVAVAHNDMEMLADIVARLERPGRSIWYVADGIYSMYGDTSPARRVARLMEQHPSLHCYFDDAHGFSWFGLHGRGLVLEEMEWNDRLVVAAGLAKSFGSGGALLAFGDPDAARRVRLVGGPMNFSGPIHPPTLGAMAASADIHLSPEHHELRRRMLQQIDLVSTTLARHRLPVVSWNRTPIWLVRVGTFDNMLEVARRLVSDGFYLNPSAFPLVPVGMAGLRFTHTLSNTDAQVEGMIASFARHMHDVVGDFDTEVDLTAFESA
ncbi:aminotransferase class I/II-fold pyridoxal phosphate-dependent enzyme [soil metagenome]